MNLKVDFEIRKYGEPTTSFTNTVFIEDDTDSCEECLRQIKWHFARYNDDADIVEASCSFIFNYIPYTSKLF